MCIRKLIDWSYSLNVFSRSFQICAVSLITQLSLCIQSSVTKIGFSLMKKSSAFRLMLIFFILLAIFVLASSGDSLPGHQPSCSTVHLVAWLRPCHRLLCTMQLACGFPKIFNYMHNIVLHTFDRMWFHLSVYSLYCVDAKGSSPVE